MMCMDMHVGVTVKEVVQEVVKDPVRDHAQGHVLMVVDPHVQPSA